MAQEAWVTLQEIVDLKPCQAGWRKLIRGLEYDRRYSLDCVCVPLSLIYEAVGDVDFDWLMDGLRRNRFIDDNVLHRWCKNWELDFYIEERSANDIHLLKSLRRKGKKISLLKGWRRLDHSARGSMR